MPDIRNDVLTKLAAEAGLTRPCFIRDYDDHQDHPRPDRLLLAKNPGKSDATFHRHNAFRENGDREGRNIRRDS
jgi:hypothetical protein